MYAIYRELHPPTGVEHCLECHFFNLKRKSLVVAAASVLKVYDLCSVSVHNKVMRKPVREVVCFVSRQGQETENGTETDEKGVYKMAYFLDRTT